MGAFKNVAWLGLPSHFREAPQCIIGSATSAVMATRKVTEDSSGKEKAC